MTTQPPPSAANACYWKDVWKKLYGLRRSWKLCDVTLLSEDGDVFKAHSIILASGSSVFHAQLVDKSQTFMQEVDKSIIKLHGVTKDVLEVTLDFIYGVTPESIPNFKKLQKGADILGIHGARTFCTQQLMELEQLFKNDNANTTPAPKPVAKCPVKTKPPAILPVKKEANIEKCPFFCNRGAEINYSVPLKKRFLMKVLTELKIDHIKASPGEFPHEEAALREMTSEKTQSLDRDSDSSTVPATESENTSCDQSTSFTRPIQNSNSVVSRRDFHPNVGNYEGEKHDTIHNLQQTSANQTQQERHMQVPLVRADSLMDIGEDFINNAKELIPHHIPDLSLLDSNVRCPHLDKLAKQDNLGLELQNGGATHLSRKNSFDMMNERSENAHNWKRTDTSVNMKGLSCDQGPANPDNEVIDCREQNPNTFSLRHSLQSHDPGRGLWDTFTEVADRIISENTDFSFESRSRNNASTLAENSGYDIAQETHTLPENLYIGRCNVLNQQPQPSANYSSHNFGGLNGQNDAVNVPYQRTGVNLKVLQFNNVQTGGSYELPTINSAAFHSMTKLKQNGDFMEGLPYRKELSPSYSGSVSSTALSPNNRTPNLSPNSASSCSSAGLFDQNQDHFNNAVGQNSAQNALLSRQNSTAVTNNSSACYAAPNQKVEEKWLNGDCETKQFSQERKNSSRKANPAPSIQQQINADPVIITSMPSEKSAFLNPEPITANAVVDHSHLGGLQHNDQSQGRNSMQACLEDDRLRHVLHTGNGISDDTQYHGGYGHLNKFLSLKTEPGLDITHVENTNPAKNCTTFHADERSSARKSSGNNRPVERSIVNSESLGQPGMSDGLASAKGEVGSLDWANNEELMKMLQEGVDNKLYKCLENGCVYSNKMVEYVQSHMYHRHGYGAPEVGCCRCDKAYFSESQLRTHVKQCHEKPSLVKSGSKNYGCEDCSEVFKTMQSLQTHQLKIHGKGRLFSCPDCDFKSPRKKDMQGHMISQHDKAPSGVRVFECSHCAYKCIDKNRFTEHEASHSSEKNYQCSKCDKSYSTKRGLRNHVKYHSTERPHVCHVCSATFKVRAKLRDHVKLMHLNKGQKPYKCGHCTFRASVRGNVNQHIRNTHKGLPVVVVDTQEKQRKHVKDYDYANLSGDGIEEVMDASASGYANKAK